MNSQVIKEEYFNWLCKIIPDGIRRMNMSYLLQLLYDLDFVPIIERDENRWSDGADVRYLFAWQNDMPYELVDQLLVKRCSILELLVALSYKMEDNLAYLNGPSRVDVWFMQMLDSLGLAEMSNNFFNEEEVRRKIETFVNRNYEYNGKGGLFTLNDPQEDQRNIDIWKQLSSKCSELLINETLY